MAAAERTGIVLIGMPGAGKSTIGVLVAKHAALDFVDTDLLIQTQTGERLQETRDRLGYVALRAIEERVILGFRGSGSVIATGGSAVYSEPAMRHLAGLGTIVHLSASLELLRERLQDFATRGIAGPAGQTLEDVYQERMPLYARFAEVTVPCAGRQAEELAREVVRLCAVRRTGVGR